MTKAEQVLKVAVEDMRTVLLLGPPGCGKTALGLKVARELGYEHLALHTQSNAPTDIAGLYLPTADGGVITKWPEHMERIFKATKPTVISLEDIAHADPAVLMALAPLFHRGERVINGQKISPYVRVIATGNGIDHKAEASPLASTILGRCDVIIHVRPELEEVLEIFTRLQFPQEIIMFLLWAPKIIESNVYTTPTNNPSSGYTSLRNLEAAGWLVKKGLATIETLAPKIGTGAASELIGFLETMKEFPKRSTILKVPMEARVPTDTSKAIAFMYPLSRWYTQGSPEDKEAIKTYINRFSPTVQQVFNIRTGLHIQDKALSDEDEL